MIFIDPNTEWPFSTLSSETPVKSSANVIRNKGTPDMPTMAPNASPKLAPSAHGVQSIDPALTGT